jgi:hypothetical protein
LGSKDLEVHSSRLPWANSLRDPISKITRAKCTGDLVQALCKCEALSSSTIPLKKKEKECILWAKPEIF